MTKATKVDARAWEWHCKGGRASRGPIAPGALDGAILMGELSLDREVAYSVRCT